MLPEPSLRKTFLHSGNIDFRGGFSWQPSSSENAWQAPDPSISSVILRTLEAYSKFFKIEGYRDVFDYILDNSGKTYDIFSLLHTAYMLKLKYFGEEAQIALTVNEDPEIDDKFLRILIRLNEYPEDFMPKLHNLRKEYSKESSRRSFWIFISSDYKPPE